jgi:putative hydrolase of the HAD superfamily
VKISTVLFDADGVLQSAGPLFDHFDRREGWSQERLSDFFRHFVTERPDYAGSETGDVDPVPVIAAALSDWGWTEPVDTFIREWLTLGTVPDKRALDLIATLRRHGISCGLATNQDAVRARYMHEDLGYEKLFDHHFYSARLGYAKPDAAFFRAALEVTGADPEQVLFIDDHEPNVEAARACGLHADIHRPGAVLRDTLLAYGLPV